MRRSRINVGILYRLGVMSVMVVWWPASTGFAERVGSPADILERGQWIMSLDGGWLARTMKGGAKAFVYEGGHSRGYGLTNRLSLYGKIGIAYLDVHDSAFPQNIRSGFGANVVVDAKLKAILWESHQKDWVWGGSAQYIFLGAPHKRKNNQANWNEWQFSTSLAKSFGRVTPYAGIKLSLLQFRYLLRNQTTHIQSRYRPDGLVGPFGGIDLAFGEQKDTVLNIEGAYVGGPEITVALTKRF